MTSAPQEAPPRASGRFGRNLLWAGLGEGGSKLLGMAANVVAARTLGVEAFGLFTLAQSVATWIWLLGGLGTPVYAVREVSRAPGRAAELLGDLLPMRLLGAATLWGLVALGVAAGVAGEGTRGPALVFAAAYGLAMAPSTDWVLRGLERFQDLAGAYLLASGSWLLLAAWSLDEGSGAPRAIAYWVGAQGLGALGMLALTRLRAGVPVRLRAAPAAWYEHLRQSSFFMVSGATRVGAQLLPLMIVDAWASPTDLGLYSASYRIVILIAYGGGLLAQAAYPILSSLGAREDLGEFCRAARRLEGFVAVLGLLLALGVTGAARPGLGALFGPKYAAAAAVLEVMAWYLPAFMLRSVYGPELQALGGQRLHAACSVLGLLLCAALTPWLLGTYGARGAAAAWALSELGLMAATGWALRSTMRRRRAAP